MINNTTLSFNKLLLTLLFAVSIISTGCDRTISKEDVETQAEDAKRELQKAREETKKAFEIKHDYLRQEQQKLIDRLEARVNELNGELNRLQSVAEQSGDIAISDVNAAMSKVEQERRRVEQQLVQVQNTPIIRWDDVSRDVNASVATIERSIDEMIDDLRRLDIEIKTQQDTTAVLQQ
ncbi:hypothetical protein BH23BAC1_BH23BAC1_20220 [soil metagenome]